MALLDNKMLNFGIQNVFGATAGAADLPTTNTAGVIQLGDLVLNLSGAVGAPAFWVCTTAGATPTFTSGGATGVGTATRSVAGSATLATTDRYLFITAAGTVTLPAPSAALAVHQYDVKAMAQPVTITAASGNLDNVATGSITLTSLESVNLMTDGTNWFSMEGREEERQVRTAAGPLTTTVRDRYVITSGAITLPAPAGWSIGREQIIHATGTSTITPASGNINAVAAVTLTTAQNARVFCDGTNFFTAN